eukprot:tig00000455_g1021.t1
MGFPQESGKKIEGVPNPELTFKPSRKNALRAASYEPKLELGAPARHTHPALKPHQARSPTRYEDPPLPFPFQPVLDASAVRRPYRAPLEPVATRVHREEPPPPNFPFAPDFAGSKAPPPAPLPFTFSPSRAVAIAEVRRDRSPPRPLTERRNIPVELPPLPFSFKPDRHAAIRSVTRPKTVPPAPVVPRRRPQDLIRSMPAPGSSGAGVPGLGGEVGTIPE